MANNTNEVFKGSCLCGGIQYEVDPTSISTQQAHCHCVDCRKHCGAAFSTYGETNRLTFVKGKDLLTTFQSSNGARRQFCRVCGSSLTFRGANTNDNNAQEEEAIEFSLATLDSESTTTITKHPSSIVNNQNKDSWTGKLILKAKVVLLPQDSSFGDYQEMDVLAHFPNMLIFPRAVIAFDPSLYPVGTTTKRKFTNQNPGWKALKQAMCQAARLEGYDLAKNSNQFNSGVIKCHMGTTHVPAKTASVTEHQFHPKLDPTVLPLKRKAPEPPTEVPTPDSSEIFRPDAHVFYSSKVPWILQDEEDDGLPKHVKSRDSELVVVPQPVEEAEED